MYLSFEPHSVMVWIRALFHLLACSVIVVWPVLVNLMARIDVNLVRHHLNRHHTHGGCRHFQTYRVLEWLKYIMYIWRDECVHTELTLAISTNFFLLSFSFDHPFRVYCVFAF